MSDFSKHEQLKGKWSQEGLRFLRFSGQRPTEFRTYIFLAFIKRFLILFSSIIALLSFCPIFLLFKLPGIAIATLTYAFLTGTFFIMKRVANKNIDKFKSLSWIFN